MEEVANDPPPGPQGVTTLPAGVAGLALDAVLRSAVLSGSVVLAGRAGLSRTVTRLNVMEVPDVQPWVRSGELLLTTGYAVREHPEQLVDLVEGLHERGVTALAVKLGRYLESFPAEALARAEALGFPVVALDADVSFDDVLTEILTDLANRQASTLARAEQVHRRLVDVVLVGGGLDEVAGSLCDALDVAVLVTTADGRVTASAGSAADLAAASSGPWTDRTGRLRTEEEVASLGLHDDPAGLLDHGRIAAFSAARRLDEADLHALQRAATVCALVVTRDLAVAAVEDKYRADYLRDLLLGRAGSPAEAAAHARAFGWDVARPVVVLVAEPDPAVPEPVPPAVTVDAADDATPPDPVAGGLRRPLVERQAQALSGALLARDPAAAVAALRTESVALVGVPADGDVRRLVREVVAAVRGDGGGGRRSIGVGVSRVCADVDGLPRGYEQARTAVRVGRQVHGTGALTHFDDLGVYRVLSLVSDEAELRSFAAETLGELAGAEAEHADLRETLEVLLETNLNVAETARRMHFHYNTLRYRIAKLERVVGPFTTEPTLRLDLALALKVLAMRGLG